MNDNDCSLTDTVKRWNPSFCKLSGSSAADTGLENENLTSMDTIGKNVIKISLKQWLLLVWTQKVTMSINHWFLYQSPKNSPKTWKIYGKGQIRQPGWKFCSSQKTVGLLRRNGAKWLQLHISPVPKSLRLSAGLLKRFHTNLYKDSEWDSQEKRQLIRF